MVDQESGLLSSLTTTFAANVFSLDVIKKAAYPFTDKASFDFRTTDSSIEVSLSFVPSISQPAAAALLADFKSEVLDQDLRQKISEETAPMRNAILGYAFSRTNLQGE
jgi:His-Xaa-Ser system protein HxsD